MALFPQLVKKPHLTQKSDLVEIAYLARYLAPAKIHPAEAAEVWARAVDNSVRRPQKQEKKTIFMFWCFLTELIYTIHPGGTVLIEGKSVILQTISCHKELYLS